MIKLFNILFFLFISITTCFSQQMTLKFKNDTLLLFPKFSALSSFEKENNNIFLFGISLKLKHDLKTNFNITYDYLEIDNIKIIKNYYDSLSIYPNFNNKNVRLRYNVNHKFKSFFSIESGKGNHFIGDGYRSLLLSNNQAPYSYVELTTKFGKVTYKNLYSTLNNLNNNNLN